MVDIGWTSHSLTCVIEFNSFIQYSLEISMYNHLPSVDSPISMKRNRTYKESKNRRNVKTTQPHPKTYPKLYLETERKESDK